MCVSVRLQVVKEYTSKVDMLLQERQEQAATQEAAQKEQQTIEAQRNAYQTLMPLALPAPGVDSGYYQQPQAQQFAYGGPTGGYGAPGYAPQATGYGAPGAPGFTNGF